MAFCVWSQQTSQSLQWWARLRPSQSLLSFRPISCPSHLAQAFLHFLHSTRQDPAAGHLRTLFLLWRSSPSYLHGEVPHVLQVFTHRSCQWGQWLPYLHGSSPQTLLIPFSCFFSNFIVTHHFLTYSVIYLCILLKFAVCLPLQKCKLPKPWDFCLFRPLLHSKCLAHRTVLCSVAQSCLTLWDPMDCSLLGSSVHGIFQARILEWAPISFSRGSSQRRD